MAFSEAQLNAVMDPANGGRTVTLGAFIPGSVNTDCYCAGVMAPFAGRSRWVQIPNSNTAAQAWALIQTALA